MVYRGNFQIVNEAEIDNIDGDFRIKTRFELVPNFLFIQGANADGAGRRSFGGCLKAQSIRMIAPIPGKSVVGIEVPNSTMTVVYLKEVLESEAFRRSPSKLTLALGKDTGGAPLVADLADMPHLLIAGTTGSGKTVCINSIIASLLFNTSPDELKFLMVDPKMVELALFNNLPHLIAPVVTEPKKVKGALAWVVQEMDSRYQLLAKVGVRHMDMYNQRISQKKDLPEGGPFERLPYLVVVIDELADLMMVVPQEVESAITQIGRASCRERVCQYV